MIGGKLIPLEITYMGIQIIYYFYFLEHLLSKNMLLKLIHRVNIGNF